MSYHIYTTKSVVLSERSLREADRIYSVLTRDLGLIRATATGVRKEASKLRGALEPISLSTISLIKGKEYWRITSAEVTARIEPIPEVLRPLSLLEKLVQGEAYSPELFDAVEESLSSPYESDEMFETLFVAKMLFHLGYLKETDLKLPKKELIKSINTGLEASHLNI